VSAVERRLFRIRCWRPAGPPLLGHARRHIRFQGSNERLTKIVNEEATAAKLLPELARRRAQIDTDEVGPSPLDELEGDSNLLHSG
jgi:hypothetical protein